jgi:hypothetical protein
VLQPVLMRLQRHAVAVAERSELYAEDERLLDAVGEPTAWRGVTRATREAVRPQHASRAT